jgi:hypothetical protein
MILIFPMLTDESVSQNALPGICKALEKFILIYELDAIMKITGFTVLAIGGKLAGHMMGKVKKEQDILESILQEIRPLPGARTKNPSYGDSEDPNQDEQSARKKGFHKPPGPGEQIFDAAAGLKDLGTIKAEMPKEQALSVEPTYMTVTTTVGTRIIGVKVIPIPIKSSRYTLAELLTADSSLNRMDELVYKMSRKVIRGFWALCRGLRIPFLGDRIVSGDPEKDILWAQSIHKRYVFCLLNYSDFSDSELFKDVGGVHKLHSVGWNSFVVMDDVNKRAIFCMKEFHGLCSSVPYQFIYSSLGKEHAKVYDNLEDLKKSASPFFKSTYTLKKLFGESKKVDIDNYLKEC